MINGMLPLFSTPQDSFSSTGYHAPEPWSSEVAAAPFIGPAPAPKFEEYMRQLKEQSAAGPSSNSGLSALSDAQIDLFRDSVVFTPPPEAQRDHLKRMASQQAKVDTTPERPVYSPLSEKGGK